MLTFIVRSKADSLLLIDEPDIYLHADLQRQLLSILRDNGPDIIIATHSPELISEASPDELVVIDKSRKRARRLTDPSQVTDLFSELGSSLNPTLTQLAKTRRILFVEGDDFRLYARIARKLGLNNLANRGDFAVVRVKGFDDKKVGNYIEGIEETLGTSILAAVIFDRDYRSDEEVLEVSRNLEERLAIVHILQRKEIENYLLVPSVIRRAIDARISAATERKCERTEVVESIEKLLDLATEPLRSHTQAQLLARHLPYKSKTQKGKDVSSLTEDLIAEFERSWTDLTSRLVIVPGKKTLSELNTYLQGNYGISTSVSLLAGEMKRSEVPPELKELFLQLENFRKTAP